MSVRAKMQCSNFASGKVGRQLYMSAVYEGSNELQAISENAIFGEATPMGNLHLSGELPERFEEREEYYIDLITPEEQWDHEGVLFEAPARTTFRSEFNPSMPTAHIFFRFAVGVLGSVIGELDMSIANPAAVEMLDSCVYYRLAIRLARKKAGDKEITIRAAMLADSEAMFGKSWDAPEPVGDTWRIKAYRSITGDGARVSREEYVSYYTRDLRRKLAIAKGEMGS